MDAPFNFSDLVGLHNGLVLFGYTCSPVHNALKRKALTTADGAEKVREPGFPCGG